MTEKNLYEIMFILKSDLGEQQTEKDVKEVKELIISNDGAVTFEDVWGIRDFAYRIEKQENGYYVVLNFEIDSGRLAELNHQLNLNQHVLRHLITAAPAAYSPVTFEVLKQEQEQESGEVEAKRKEARDKKSQKEARPHRKKYDEKAKPYKKTVEKEKKGEEIPEIEEKQIKKKAAKPKISELEDVDEKLKNIINDPDISL